METYPLIGILEKAPIIDMHAVIITFFFRNKNEKNIDEIDGNDCAAVLFVAAMEMMINWASKFDLASIELSNSRVVCNLFGNAL